MQFGRKIKVDLELTLANVPTGTCAELAVLAARTGFVSGLRTRGAVAIKDGLDLKTEPKKFEATFIIDDNRIKARMKCEASEHDMEKLRVVKAGIPGTISPRFAKSLLREVLTWDNAATSMESGFEDIIVASAYMEISTLLL